VTAKKNYIEAHFMSCHWVL